MMQGYIFSLFLGKFVDIPQVKAFSSHLCSKQSVAQQARTSDANKWLMESIRVCSSIRHVEGFNILRVDFAVCDGELLLKRLTFFGLFYILTLFLKGEQFKSIDCC